MIFQVLSVFKEISTTKVIIQEQQQSTVRSNLYSDFSIKPKIQLDTSFFTNILSCEEMIHTHIYDINTVEKLIKAYAQLVEYFDETKEGLKSYFLEKIQFLLSRPETVKLLIKATDVEQTQSWEIAYDAQRLTSLPEKDLERFHSADDQPQIRYSIFKKKQERACQIKILIEVQEQKGECQKDLKMLLKEYEDTSKEYDQIIKEQMQSQDSIIKEKLRLRSGQKRQIMRATSAESGAFLQPCPLPCLKSQHRINRVDKIKPFSQISFTLQDKRLDEVQEGVEFMRKSISLIANRTHLSKRMKTIV